MPTLQRYKKLYQDRLPSVGQGRKQRYPESALPVFDQIKTENAGKRGRPRKAAAAPRAAAAAPARRRGRRPGRPPAAAPAGPRKAAAKRGGARRGRPPGRPPGRPAAAAKRAGRRGTARSSGGLLTLTEISKQTGISYPTLVRYVKLHAGRLPHEGTGRTRRFYPQAVDVFRQLRSESGRGGRRKGAGRAAAPTRGRAAAAASGAFAKRMKAIEKSQRNLEKKLKGLVKNLQKLFR
jgi:excisionase family DNA binding protein